MLVFLEHLILTVALLLLVAVVDLNEVMTVSSRPLPKEIRNTYLLYFFKVSLAVQRLLKLGASNLSWVKFKVKS